MRDHTRPLATIELGAANVGNAAGAAIDCAEAYFGSRPGPVGRGSAVRPIGIETDDPTR